MNPFALTGPQFLGLLANLPRLRARQERIAAAASGRVLSVDAVYDLVLAETEDEEQAQRAATDYAAAVLRSGQTPG